MAQQWFAQWIKEEMPFLLPLFDFERGTYLPEAVERYLGVASHGQAILARFALGVWQGRDSFDFDFTDAAAVLEPQEIKIITDWMTTPKWP